MICVEYRPIAGSPGFRVGTDGSVWSCWQRKMLIHGRGSRMVMCDSWHEIAADWKPKSGRVTIRLGGRVVGNIGRLVLETFVGPCPSGKECCHFPDRNPLNNRLGNLRWDTRRANVADAKVHGTWAAAERNGRRKLSRKDVERIRRMSGTSSSIAAELGFKVTRRQIDRVRSKFSWGSI